MFDFSILCDNGTLIEKAGSLLELTRTVELNAGRYLDDSDRTRLSDFQLVSQSSRSVGMTSVVMVFVVSWTGIFDRRWAFEIHALPSNVWNLGVPGTNCQGYEGMRLIPGSSCVLVDFAGARPGTSNGFRIMIGETSAIGPSGAFRIVVPSNPEVPVNLLWMITAARTHGNDKGKFCSSQVSGPVSVVGTPTGILHFEDNTQQTVSVVGGVSFVNVHLSLKPGNGVLPYRPSVGTFGGGFVTVQPPIGWTIIEERVLNFTSMPMFGETRYETILQVETPKVWTSGFAWTITISQILPTGIVQIVASTQAVPGLPVPATTSAFTVVSSSTITGQLTNLRFEYVSLVNGPRKITAPFGYMFDSKCPGFTSVVAECLCVGSRHEWFTLSPECGLSFVFTIQTVHPHNMHKKHEWTMETFAWDGSVVELGTVDSAFVLFPFDFFKFFNVNAVSRLPGVQNVSLTFSAICDAGDVLLVKSPYGGASRLLWTNITLDAVPANGVDGVSLKVGRALVYKQVYGITLSVVVSNSTPLVNRWWIESSNRLVGKIASKSAAGFATQALANLTITPYDTQVGSIRNFILVEFQTTTTLSGNATIRIVAPAGFTFLCLSPETLSAFDDLLNTRRISCSVSNGGIVANLTGNYSDNPLAIVVWLTNPPQAVATGVFTVATYTGTILIEQGLVPVFAQTSSMPNSQYFSIPGREDLRPNFINSATFILGFVAPVSRMSLYAPDGYSFCLGNNVCTASRASYLNVKYNLLPSGITCVCHRGVSSSALITFSSIVPGGVYGLNIQVRNPLASARWNYWRVASGNATESWMRGYVLQEVFDVEIRSLNAAMNNVLPSPIEFRFNTTSALSSNGEILITAPPGFTTDLNECKLTGLESGTSLPAGTTCVGNEGTATLSINGPLPAGRWGFRIEAFIIPSSNGSSAQLAIGWSIGTYFSGGSLVDGGSMFASFPLFGKLANFNLVSQTSVLGLAVSNVTLNFQLSEPLLPGGEMRVSTAFSMDMNSTRCDSSHVYSSVSSEIVNSTWIPSFVSCRKMNSNLVILRNEEPVRLGRILHPEHTYFFIIPGVSNPAITPEWNYWSVEVLFGQSPWMWGIKGYSILPQLVNATVVSSNPALGQFATFTVEFVIVSFLPVGGIIRVEAEGFDFSSPVCAFSESMCLVFPSLCSNGFVCTGETDELQIQVFTSLPANFHVNFTITGFNAVSPIVHWKISTKPSGDSKLLVSPFLLYPAIVVHSIVASTSKVSAANNTVTVLFTLPLVANFVSISFPPSFTGTPKKLPSPPFPNSEVCVLSGSSEIYIYSPTNETIPAGVPLSVPIVVGNPAMVPGENTWELVAGISGVLNAVNLNVTGFSIFGDFVHVGLVGRVLAPNKTNTVGVSFMLASDLPWTEDETFFIIEIPNGYLAIDSFCGKDLFSYQYTRYEGADSQFPNNVLIALPSGSTCNTLNNTTMRINLDSTLLAGVSYAFQIGVINPTLQMENFWQLKTSIGSTILHVSNPVPGLGLQVLEKFTMAPSNPSKFAINNFVYITLQSSKSLPAGSRIRIEFPPEFRITCFGVTFDMLQFGKNAKCQFGDDFLEIVMDQSNSVIGPFADIWFQVLIPVNPGGSPWSNYWSALVLTRDGLSTIDVMTNVAGFDVTGQIFGSVVSRYIYTNQQTVVLISFSSTTTQSRGLAGNSLVITTPPGFIITCSKYDCACVTCNDNLYALENKTICESYSNETLRVYFPTGFGLHAGNTYEIHTTVVNAKTTNTTDKWTFATLTENGLTADFNSSIPGYTLLKRKR